MAPLLARLPAGPAALIVIVALGVLAGPALASPLGGGSSLLNISEHAPARISAVASGRRERPGDALAQAAQTRASRFAAILATPCAHTDLLPSAENISQVDGAVLCLVNRERAEHRVLPLSSNPDLERAALEHARELVADDYFAHVTPAGYTPADRVRATGYLARANAGWLLGENLAWGTYSLSTPAAIVAGWIASPGHLANILESRYTETGIGVTPRVPPSRGGGNAGALYAQEFGAILH